MKIKCCLLNVKIEVDSLQTVIVKNIMKVATWIQMDSFTQSHYSWAQQPTYWGTLKRLVGQTQQCNSWITMLKRTWLYSISLHLGSTAYFLGTSKRLVGQTQQRTQQLNNNAQKQKVIVIHQICEKPGHKAISFWNRYNHAYQDEEIPISHDSNVFLWSTRSWMDS